MEPIPVNPDASGTAEPPALPWEKARKPPWKPHVSGVAAVLCGPFAGGLITHANLRRLGSPRTGLLILALTTLYTAFFSLVLWRLSEVSGTLLDKFAAYFILPFLFPMLQRKEFARWRTDHPKVEPAEDWRATGLALLGLVGFLVIYAGVGILPVVSDVRNVEIEIFAPTEVPLGETFEIVVQAKNTATFPQTLRELHIQRTYLSGVSIFDTDPGRTRTYTVPLVDEEVFEFLQEIPAKSQIAIHLIAQPKTPGEHKGKLGVCINYAASCLYYDVDVKVSTKE